jgi:hypothetical protein
VRSSRSKKAAISFQESSRFPCWGWADVEIAPFLKQMSVNARSCPFVSVAGGRGSEDYSRNSGCGDTQKAEGFASSGTKQEVSHDYDPSNFR